MTLGPILPGRFGLIIPREPIGGCELCGTPFYSDRDLRAHFGTVEHRENAQRMVEARERHKATSIMHDDQDPEVTEHMREVGKRMLREGRWVVKKNERAGWS